MARLAKGACRGSSASRGVWGRCTDCRGVWGSWTGSGSVINRDVEPGALALARARQENKPGFATRFFARLRALKSQMGKGA